MVQVKSTLLKILSRITWPSSGEVQIQGKVASLLEVGTGFHLDLTGKENVYLNGTYLGMTKKEIDDKYEEIVSFSNVGKFIDTPVKRYSTGMLMRLAFSVAAFLDTEVLLIDEVLAVGDASFQKKCLGKMDELSKSGKTVLFVSHQIPALRSLCEKGLLFDGGKLIFQGEINECIDQHLRNQKVNTKENTKMFKPHDSIDIKNFKAEIFNNHLKIFYDYKLKQTVNNLCMGFVIIDMNGNKLLNSFDIETFRDRGVGEYSSVFSLTINALRPGDYIIKSIIIFREVEWYEKENISISINIPGSDNDNDIYNNGLLKRIGEWEILKK